MLMKKPFLLLSALLIFTTAFCQLDSAQIRSFLPLQVVSFDAKVVNRNVQLIWTISRNEEVKGYEIERAIANGNYDKIGGRLSSGQEGAMLYEFVDALPKTNIDFHYRVKVLAKDGSFLYSDLRQVKIEEGVLQFKLKQNPVRNLVQVDIKSVEAGQLQATIYTSAGQRILTETVKLATGLNQVSISSQNLLPGLHRLVLELGKERKVISFVKE